MNERRNDLEIMNWIPQIALQIQNSDQSPLYDVRNPASEVCEDLACEVMFRGRLFEAPCSKLASIFDQPVFALSSKGLPSRSWRSQRRLVEPDGIEPTTSCLQSTRSPS
jgi:hypothetical protein